MGYAAKEKVDRFRALHQKGAAFLFPNFWDVGSAKTLEALGFPALASTSSGFALTKGAPDYGVTRDDVIAHARAVCEAVEAPVAADLENGFGPSPEDCAETVGLAAQAGLCGGSIEDSTGEARAPVHEHSAAVERIAAAVEAGRAAPGGFVLTARAEAFLYGDADLDDVILRLQAFEAAGADVLFAPGLPDIAAVQTVCAALNKPVNALVLRGLSKHGVEDFRAAGVARLSLGGALAFSAYGAMAETAAAVRDTGRFDVLGDHSDGRAVVSRAVGDE